jgi:hypothetical protein
MLQGEQEAGYHDVMFDATGLSAGVYFYLRLSRCRQANRLSDTFWFPGLPRAEGALLAHLKSASHTRRGAGSILQRSFTSSTPSAEQNQFYSLIFLWEKHRFPPHTLAPSGSLSLRVTALDPVSVPLL